MDHSRLFGRAVWGLPSSQYPLQLGLHSAAIAEPKGAAGRVHLEHSSNAPRTIRPRRVGHCDDSPEPYPLPDRRLARERRCQIIRAELVIIWLHQQVWSSKFVVRARAECRIRSAVHRGTESWVCAAQHRAPSVHGHWSGIRVRAGSDPSALGEPHQSVGPPLKSRHSSCRAYRVALEPVP